jgi:hypothetical protein
MSHTKGFDRRAGRGRDLAARRRVSVPVLVSACEARSFLADLLDRRSCSRENTAMLFEVTFQTACNWHDGFTVPTGDKVLTMMRLWPEEFIQREAA